MLYCIDVAEQRLRDKLAAAAREKMSQVTQNTKEKSLQAERKRKAAMFVNMLKTKQKDPPVPMIGESSKHAVLDLLLFWRVGVHGIILLEP